MKTSRCTGHCCRGFALEESYSDLQKDYAAWQKDPKSSRIPEIEIIAPMVIPVKTNVDYDEYIYTCKNLNPKGDCTIYADRPQMCRAFPESSGCRFWRCTSDQSIYFRMSFINRLKLRYFSRLSHNKNSQK